MSVCLVTGSAGLIGSEATRHFGRQGHHVVGVDNDMRSTFFGKEASTAWTISQTKEILNDRYEHHSIDIRDRAEIDRLFRRFGKDISLVVHTAAQPSHDWAAKEPFTDFDINAGGTLNVLEATRRHAPSSVFIFTSTNKVYGDAPNRLPLVESDSRYEIAEGHSYANGIREDLTIDQSLHSVFGASKVAADVMVQEYGRYFDMATACFRGGTLTGAQHSATQLHGFLGYVMRCTMTGTPYTVFGYKGKQVRDAIHCNDLIRAFECFYKNPKVAEVYNIGGGRFSNCSVLEAIGMSERISGRELTFSYEDKNRTGDHIWWIGDNGKFAYQYPEWRQEYSIVNILEEMFAQNQDRWKSPA